MTIWAETMVQPAPLQSVIDWSMTVFAVTLAETMVHPAALQTVIDRSMTVLVGVQKVALGTFRNCQ